MSKDYHIYFLVNILDGNAYLKGKKLCKRKMLSKINNSYILVYYIFFGVSLSGNLGLKYIEIIKLPKNLIPTL
jgi:hypothetical protein